MVRHPIIKNRYNIVYLLARLLLVSKYKTVNSKYLFQPKCENLALRNHWQISRVPPGTPKIHSNSHVRESELHNVYVRGNLTNPRVKGIFKQTKFKLSQARKRKKSGISLASHADVLRGCVTNRSEGLHGRLGLSCNELTVNVLKVRHFSGAPNDNFRENICSEDDLRSRIFGTFVVKFFACLPLLGFSNI